MIDVFFDILIGLSILVSALVVSNKTRIGKYINDKNKKIHKHNKNIYPDYPPFSQDSDKE